jgi:hypothetical protein
VPDSSAASFKPLSAFYTKFFAKTGLAQTLQKWCVKLKLLEDQQGE